MGHRWREASGEQVELKIYAGGVAGNEGDMVRKMRIGQLHAAALTVVGVGEIDPSPQAISTPGLIADDQEWQYVFARLQPLWAKRLADKGYHVLLWGDTGWVHLFMKRPVSAPTELKGMRVFAWAGSPKAVEAWKLAGFQPVVLSATDILPSLSTGMIDGYAATAIAAMTTRWYEQTPYMTASTWAHLPGATLVQKSVWEKIPADKRDILSAIAREYAAKVDAEVNRMQADAIAVMKKNGVTVVEFNEAGRKQWDEICERAWPAIRGGVVSTGAFDEVLRIRDEYRASHAAR
jgi:TRAP-type C4-dicarboxylate transport system substrate-binding protein